MKHNTAAPTFYVEGEQTPKNQVVVHLATSPHWCGAFRLVRSLWVWSVCLALEWDGSDDWRPG